MKFIDRTIVIFIAVFLLLSICISAQTKSSPRAANSAITMLNGAYAGNSLPSNDPFTGGMRFETFAFYFRPNGTYTDELHEPDWQTRIDGTYKITGNKLVIQSNLAGNDPEELEIKEGGKTLGYRGTTIFKYNVMNSIPRVIVKNISGSSSGGIGTDRVFVGVSSTDLFNFDGKGKFRNDSSGASFVGGENITAGTARDEGTFGTYTIKDSLLTLSYNNGKIVKKSFFYSETDGFGTVLINGSFYFETEESKKTKPNITTQADNDSKIANNKSPVISILNGAYAGNSVPLFMPGGQSLSSSYRFYFRPNGTYTTELAETDWQTRKDGTYKISNYKVILFPQKDGENPFEMDIEEEGASLVYGGTTLFKLNVMNSIPAVVVENSGGTSSGGIGTPMVFVGVSFSGIYNFDGKGRFSNNASSSSMISGANVGGGSSNESGGSGNYTIKDSLLTLKYDNGKIVKKSFFYVEFDGDGTALIDGSLYYEPENSEINEKDTMDFPALPKKTTTTNNPNSPNEPQFSANSETAQRSLIILKKANYAHGGANLDNLKTLRLNGKGNGLELQILVDLPSQKIRHEIRKKGVLVQAEQFDGNDNWLFKDGEKNKLHEIRVMEMKKSLQTGLFILQSQFSSSVNFLSVEVNNETNLKSLMLLIEGKKHGMIFDADNRLVAELSADDGLLQTEYLSDFKNVNGIIFPFKSKIVEGSKSVEIKFSTIEVNPTLTAGDWEVPR